MNQKRLLWIDTAKVIGISLMILGHRNLLDINSTKVIFSFHMPLFFIISGMFWKNINLDKTIKSISKTLLLPFTIIALIWCVVYVCFYIKNGLPFSNLLPYILGTYISPGKNWGGVFLPAMYLLLVSLCLVDYKNSSIAMQIKKDYGYSQYRFAVY